MKERLDKLEKRCRHLELIEVQIAKLEQKLGYLISHQERVDALVQAHEAVLFRLGDDHKGACSETYKV